MKRFHNLLFTFRYLDVFLILKIISNLQILFYEYLVGIIHDIWKIIETHSHELYIDTHSIQASNYCHKA
jgi:hypothetical protein